VAVAVALIIFRIWLSGKRHLNLENQVSISSTLNAQILCTNVVLAAFSSYMYVEKQCLYKKFVHLALMKLTTDRRDSQKNDRNVAFNLKNGINLEK